ncbi:MAG: hypothetical protein AMXMBFR64_61740 [Myxococcales bacterium]
MYVHEPLTLVSVATGDTRPDRVVIPGQVRVELSVQAPARGSAPWSCVLGRVVAGAISRPQCVVGPLSGTYAITR